MLSAAACGLLIGLGLRKKAKVVTIWLMPRELKSTLESSLSTLESLGFEVIGVDAIIDVFFRTKPPINWLRSRDRFGGAIFRDSKGRARLSQTYGYDDSEGVLFANLGILPNP